MNLPKHFPNTVYPNSKILNFCSCQCSCYSRYFLDSFNQVLFFNNLNFLCNFLFAVFLFFVFCFVFCLDYLEIGVHWDSTTTFPCYATGFYLLWDSVHKTSGKFVNKECFSGWSKISQSYKVVKGCRHRNVNSTEDLEDTVN